MGLEGAPLLTNDPSENSGGETSSVELSVVTPCLNEAETLERCIREAQQALRHHGIKGEIIVADNGSTDGSPAIAARMGARVVSIEDRGYGRALMAGIAAARGKYIIMGDADGTYDFAQIPRFLEKLREGCELVMGNRFQGSIEPGAMPPLHRYVGNPLLSQIGSLFFRSPCGDFHCGLRGFSKAAYSRMGLRTRGMEFATEMVVKATLRGMRIAEVPTTLSPSGRSRPPHLRTWRDGWRHLRVMLLYSPRWLFLYPGALLTLLGLLAGLWLFPGPRTIGGVTFDVPALLFAGLAVLLGFQAVAFAIFGKVFAIREGLLPPDPRLERLLRALSRETGLVLGGLLVVGGLAGSLYAVGVWGARHFGPLEPTRTLRTAIPATVALTLGVEIILSSFFLSILKMGRK
jgi:glycosyltransferase involved in cell wall biosynthesis